MKKEIGKRVRYYRKLWLETPECGPITSSAPEGKGNVFFARHHSFTRSDNRNSPLSGECTDEMFDSVFDCLAYYRWVVIPKRLQEASGLSNETDIELLLDGAGYSASLIAEELFEMIDFCLERGRCTESDLRQIKSAYNGLSGFRDNRISRVLQWGSVIPDAARLDTAQTSGVKMPHPGYIGYSAVSISRSSGAFAV